MQTRSPAAVMTVAAAFAGALPAPSTSGSTAARLPSSARTVAAPLPMRQTFGVTCARTLERSPTHAQTAGAASSELRNGSASVDPQRTTPISVLNVAGASARSQPWPSTSGSIGLVPGDTEARVPVGCLCPWPLATGTWTHLWASNTTQKYTRSVGDGLKGCKPKGGDLDVA